MNTLEKYNKIFEKVFQVNEEKLNEDFTFDSVDKWNSLAHITLISELEDEFDIMFETDDILHFKSYKNGIKILKKYGIGF